MTKTIAISGKGGSGKTTLAAMIVRELVAAQKSPVLAVDADPNACLGMTLGVDVHGDIANLREQTRKKQPTNTGIDRLGSFEYGLNEIIVEAQGYDLVAMGRPEGPDCYCAANNILRKFLDRLTLQYKFVILDNEAGMEHLSRRTTNNVDVLFVVVEPSPIGRVTATRIYELIETLPISIKQPGIVWSRSDSVEQLNNYTSFGCIPYDQTLLDASREGKNIFELDSQSPAFVAVRDILNKTVLNGN